MSWRRFGFILFGVLSFWDLLVYVVAVVQSLSCIQLFVTPWIAARQASLSYSVSQNLLKLMSTESVMPSNHLILCRPLFLLPSIFPSIRAFSNELALCIRWPRYWSFKFISCQNWEIFSHYYCYFFECFFSPAFFLLSFWDSDDITLGLLLQPHSRGSVLFFQALFSLLLELGDFYCPLFQVPDSSLSLHPSMKCIQWAV